MERLRSETGHPTYLMRSTCAQEISRTDCLMVPEEIETIRPLMHLGRQGRKRFLYALHVYYFFPLGGPVLCRTEQNKTGSPLHSLGHQGLETVESGYA